MKIGLVVDGDSEYYSLPIIKSSLETATGNQLMGPLKADIQPKAPVNQIAYACHKHVKFLLAKGSSRVVVVLDREDRSDCPGSFAESLTSSLAPRCGGNVVVVIKNSVYENWLLADVTALKRRRGRFRISNATESAIVPNKADNVDAMVLLKRSIEGKAYNKIEDAKRICEVASIDSIAANSRSFRRFLRIIGDPRYAAQSRRP